jgi:PAS domain S-box-containing protein
VGPYAIPFATFFVAVAAVAWFGGFGPALVSIALGGALAAKLFVEPGAETTAVNATSLLVYVIAGTCMALFSEGLRRERNRAMKFASAVVEQTESLNVTLRSIGDAVITTDPAGRITLINAVAQKLTGWTEAEALGQYFCEVLRVIEEDNRQSQEARLASIISERRPIALANHSLLVRKDGTEIPIDDSGAPILNAAGELGGAVIVFRDVAERRRVRRELEQSEQNLRLALVAGRMGTWARTANEIRWSPELEALFGLKPGSFAGTEEAFLELIHPDDRQPVRDSMAMVVDGRRDYELEFRITRPDGSIAWMYSRGRAEADESGRIVRRTGITMDMTAHKKLELELRQRGEELSRSNYDLEQFTYLSSHDLQEPLRTVAVYVQMLERKYRDRLDGEAPQFLEFIVSNVRRMQAQINALLEYSRAGTEQVRVEEVDANKAFDDALGAVTANIQTSGAEITHDPLPCVLANPSELTRVFQNLLSNGIRFRKPGEPPHVHVTAEQENASWVFAVHDNGIGIDTGYQQQIFEIFRRLNRQEEGTGIGLAVCKRIVERNGGRIWVESSRGEGATFKFTMPAVPHLAVASIPHSA